MTDPSLTRRRLVALTGAAAASLAGCTGGTNDATPEGTAEPGDGEDRGDGGSETEYEGVVELPAEPAAEATVSMRAADDGSAYYFDPHLVWVRAGGTVTWELGAGSHSATAYHPDNDEPRRIPDAAAAFDSGVREESDAPFERAFDEPGVYDYYCRSHRSGGMVGTVVVGTPDPEGQPGLADPQDELPNAGRIAALNESAAALLTDG